MSTYECSNDPERQHRPADDAVRSAVVLFPLPLLLGAFVSAVTAIPTAVGVGAGCVPSALLFWYVVVIAPPTGREKTVSERSA